MGAGRKTQTLYLKEKSIPYSTENCRVTARNLSKSELAGVIFGCKNHTIEECFSNRLFGLPGPHYTYVKNINPGLPLFLFNYSDRKLHGIFEAASHGGWSINPYGWTADGLDSTPYPAQVKIRIRMECEPLLEEQFRSIIAENYYELKLFWFELDQNQTSNLISLFTSSPITSTSFKVSHAPNVRQEGDGERGKNIVPPQKLWSELFEKDAGLNVRDMKTDDNRGQEGSVDNTGSSSATQTSIVQGRDIMIPEELSTLLFKDDLESNAREVSEMKSSDLHSTVAKLSLELGDTRISQSNQAKKNNYLEDEPEGDGERGKNIVAPQKLWSELFKKDAGFIIRDVKMDDNRGQEGGVDNTGSSSATQTSIVQGRDIIIPEELSTSLFKDDLESNPREVSELKSSDLHSIVAKLSLELEDMRISQSKQAEKINYLEDELAESRIEIQQLKERCKMLESVAFPAIGLLDEEEFKLRDEPFLDLDEVILVGGFDGSLYLSSVDSYSVSQDLVKSLSSRRTVCLYASAAKLNGELYIIGGTKDNLWFNTVESYNLVNDQWTSLPSLNQNKGGLASICLEHKIFAFGGGNGVDCLSNVDVFDLNAGRWIPTQSMFHKRFTPAAAEINSMLYVVGGYSGDGYLKSVEGYDPRQHSWTGLESMTTKRAGHSLVVLNEKLYALGGYDGDTMVPTVEVFDPRIGWWIKRESMNNARGNFGAVVLGDAIYVLGGLGNDDKVLDTVECYKEGHGWQVTDLKAIGKRSLFSVVL